MTGRKSIRFKIGIAFLLAAILQACPQPSVAGDSCGDLFSNSKSQSKSQSQSQTKRFVQTQSPRSISAKALSEAAREKISAVPEFEYIREQAEQRGLRVWLFGGTASSYLHYVKWDLQRQYGLKALQADRFDYDFTNIFRSTQDLDIVIDASAEQAKEFRQQIAQQYPHFLGSKEAKWEVRTLKTRIGKPGQPTFKEALLGDADFNNQNTDSNSLGMVEITRSNEPIVRDLRHWDQPLSPFLEDTLNNRISFFRSDKHFTTSRAKAGQNPEILSVTRLAVKAFQYELTFSDADFKQMKAIVDQFDPASAPESSAARGLRGVFNKAVSWFSASSKPKQTLDPVAVRRLQDTAKKLVMHATNIEYAMDKLDELGLRKKLIALGDKNELDSASWWLSKEPLRSKPVGQGAGATAASLGIQVVAHETSSFLAYESITRSHSGEPNVLISRSGAAGEFAVHGDGFYTRLGTIGARGTGLTIRFTVDPNAREGTDFVIPKNANEYVIFRNKKALKVIPESLNFGLNDLLKMAEGDADLKISESDLALLEKLKRKLNPAMINEGLDVLLSSKNAQDDERLVRILSGLQNSSAGRLISPETYAKVVENVYARIEMLYKSNSEVDQIHYIQTVGPILKTLEEHRLISTDTFRRHLEQIRSLVGASFLLRKSVVFEELCGSHAFGTDYNLRSYFSKDELEAVKKEVFEWQNSPDVRKKKFITDLMRKAPDAIKSGDIKALRELEVAGIMEVNSRNASGHSMLLIADYFKQESAINWLIQNPDFDFNAKNERGFTQVEQLRLLGKNELAERIEQERPEVRARKFKVRERNEDGSPILNFVRIEPNTFFMASMKIQVKLTKPFEIMSTQTTQQTWAEVIHLLARHLPGKFSELHPDPSFFKGTTRPVEQVSLKSVERWLEGLNKLSQMDDAEVQAQLAVLFKRHKKNDHYRIPTYAEGVFVKSNQGLAEGRFSFGNDEKDLAESTWFKTNSNGQTHPVGQKKPILVNGRPIYDIQGNVGEWVADTPYQAKLPSPFEHTAIGNGFASDAHYLSIASGMSNTQILVKEDRGTNDIGFRIVRSAQ